MIENRGELERQDVTAEYGAPDRNEIVYQYRSANPLVFGCSYLYIEPAFGTFKLFHGLETYYAKSVEDAERIMRENP